MPARVVVVHDETDFVIELATALRAEGYEVATFGDPLEAWDALSAPKLTEVLVTRVQFPAGKSNGIALAAHARLARSEIRVLFTALPEHTEATEGRGEFMALPVRIPDVVEAVIRLLTSPNSRGTNA